MAVYRNIQTSFWTDAKVADDFSPEDKFFYLYLFTNPHTNLCGCYEISKKQVSWETGYSTDTIDRLIERFQDVHDVIRYNAETKELLLLNWHKYNWTSSEKFRKPLLKEIESVKTDGFREYLLGIFKESNTVSIPYPYGTDTTVTVTVTDTVSVTDTVKEKKSYKFIPPTIDEVDAYCKERKNGINPETFYDFYQSKGWMVGKDKMKDWKAAVRTWENRNKKTQDTPKNNDKLKALEDYYKNGGL